MPKFEVVITKTETLTFTLSLEMSAKDEEAAEDKANDLLVDDDRLAALMKRQKTEWEVGDTDIEYEIESVNEL